MSKSNKAALDDIFANDEFGILDSKPQTAYIKTDEDRLIDEFEEINLFVDKNEREPSKSSMSEFSLLAKLNRFRKDESKKKLLKAFDKHNLLGHVEMELPTLDEIFEDNLGILDIDNQLTSNNDIFTYRHIPQESERAKTDFIARRKRLSEKEFAPYEKMFHQVHQDIKEGKRQIIEFKDVDRQLIAGKFYLIDGVIVLLEDSELVRNSANLHKNTRRRKDGRTRTIFENATISNMYYRSLGKAITNGGSKMVSDLVIHQPELFVNSNNIVENDENTGYIYVVKSQSTHPSIKELKDLYKIGFSSDCVEKRIKNAKNEATYLFADVEIIATYKIINRNANKLERILHKLFADACLNIEITNEKGLQIDPREWFIAPLGAINQAISLIMNGNILHYYYSPEKKQLCLKNG